MKKTNKVKIKFIKGKTNKLRYTRNKKGGASSESIAPEKVIESFKTTEIIQENKPFNEKVRNTAQNIYDKMSQNPEGALGVATIGATMLAIPLILTLAG